jgi:hypothetical protein
MRRLTRRSWIGIGCAVVSDAVHGELAAQTPPAGSAGAANDPARTGAGGEPYLRDGGPSDTRTRLTRELIVLDGCFRLFDELVAAKSWSAARQRIDDATLESREKIEPYMKGQGLRPFTPLIDEATRALDARNIAAVRNARAKLQARWSEADRVFRKYRVPFHQFALRGAIEAMKVAAKSYASAYANGADAEAADYQDGRGTVAAVDATLSGIRMELRRIDAAAADRVEAALVALKPVWSTLDPPATPAMSPEDVDARVEALEAAAVPFWTKSP